MLFSSPNKKSNSSQNYIRQGIFIGIFILAIVWLGSLIIGLFYKAQIAWETAQYTQHEARVLEQRAKILGRSMRTLDTSRGYSASVRTAFDVARKDESVIIVIPLAVSTSTKVKKGWWSSVSDILHL